MHFEKLKKEQKELVTQWLKQKYVAEFWYGIGLQNTLESIENFLTGKQTIFTHWIAYDDEVPFGFLMTSEINFENDSFYAKYLTSSSKAITLDVLIGNPSYLGKGYGQLMIREIIHQKFFDVTDVFIDPEINNLKAIHVYEKAGFCKLKEFIPDWDPSTPCMLMQLKMRDKQ